MKQKEKEYLKQKPILYQIKWWVKKYKKHGVMYFFSPAYRKYLEAREKNEYIKKRLGSLSGGQNKKFIKIELARTQGNKCNLCKKHMPMFELTLDHIKRLRDGGDNKFKNFQLLCRPCHEAKDKQFSTGMILR